jgi:hypothetical protein
MFKKLSRNSRRNSFRVLFTRLAVVVLLAAWSFPGRAGAQSSSPAGAVDDDAAIRRVAELYMSFEPAKLREGFYASSNLYVAGPQGELRVIPFDKFLENVQKGEVSGRAKPKSAIDFIDRAGTAAIVKITEHSADATVVDYLSLVRSSDGWKVVAKTFYVDHTPQAAAPASSGTLSGTSSGNSSGSSAAAAAAPAAGAASASPPPENPCGAGAEIRAFDYMLGDWTTSDLPAPAGGTAFGASHTETILGGCAIREHRHIEQAGKTLFNADVIWGYDVTTKRMLLYYVDDASRTQLYEGRRENGRWEFYRDRPDKDGTIVTIRVSYAPAGNGFTQTVHRSHDHGATWEPGQSVTTYAPK